MNNKLEIPFSSCPLCASTGEVLYAGRLDVMKPTPGSWDLMRCTSGACRLLWLNPIPGADVLAEAYKDYYTHHPDPAAAERSGLKQSLSDIISQASLVHLHRRYGYARPSIRGIKRLIVETASRFSSRKKAEWDALVTYLPANKGGVLLDIGCGSGDFLARMRDKGWKGQGCDSDPKAVNRARSRLLDVKAGCVEVQEFHADHFDAVTLLHVIEHVPEPRQTILECRRILKKNGMLVITTPNTDSLAHRLFKKNWMHLDTPRHTHLFNRPLLTKLTRECGFDDVHGFSTIYGSDLQYYFSRMIAKTGHNSMVVPPAGRMIGPRLFSFVESLGLKFSPDAGENLVVIARK